MKNPQFALALLSICVLASCNTVAGVGKDAGDVTDWTNNKPSTIGKFIGDATSGYREQPATPPQPAVALENTVNQAPYNETENESPQPVQITRPVVRASGPVKRSHLVWHKLDDYNAQNPALPDGDDYDAAPVSPPPSRRGTSSSAAPIIQYGHSVDVFPVNGDTTPYGQVNAVSGGYNGGEMVQQVFFAHGSDRVSRIDHKNLRELAQSMAHNASDYKLDVVGHASHRVNGVRDPIEKKMINFKIAQRRANAVTAELIKSGVTPGWVVATSEGDEQPNPHRNGKTQEAADRRAEVFLSTN